MDKHAYLIIAHSNLEQLHKLLLLLDDPRNDIYIHLDLKSKLDIKKITPPHMKYSHCKFCERVMVRWGNVSLIQAEMNLFELASQVEHAYYHLISGIDLPLHSQNYIHKYFDGKNFEYIGYSPKWDMRERVYCHNLFMQYMRFPNQYLRGGLQKMRQLYNKLQIFVGYKMKQPDYEFKAGCEWVSVTHDFVLSLLENKDEILKMYSYAYCPDEIYKQTFAYNSEFRNRIYNVTDEFEGCLREIDWKRGRPYIWRKEDYDYLSHSNKLFARKFDENVDEEIINMLINKIKMSKTPKVSMLIPIYGVEKFIERCAVSLFEQTYQNIEYIFVNDCTKDDSINVLERVINRYPNRKPFVRIINHTQNTGLAGARNTAVANATGEFIMHVDSDDYVDKEIVRKAIDKQLQFDADIVIIDFKKAYPGFYKITKYASFNNSEEYCLAVLARNNSNSIWAKLIRRSLYVDNGIKCKHGCNQGEDYQVVPILLYYAKKIVNLTEPLYYYDCSNEGAYSNSFTISKHDQNWESMNLVQSFFEDKSNMYRYAVDCGRLRQIADDLIISAKTHGEVSAKYYYVACLILKSIKRDLWNTIPLEKRIILYLSPYYKLMVIYILLFRKSII